MKSIIKTVLAAALSLAWIQLGSAQTQKVTAHEQSVGNDSAAEASKQAGHSAVRLDGEPPRDYQRLKLRRGSGVARVAIARKLAVRMYWMLRAQASYAQLVRMSGSPSSAVVPQGAGSKV